MRLLNGSSALPSARDHLCGDIVFLLDSSPVGGRDKGCSPLFSGDVRTKRSTSAVIGPVRCACGVAGPHYHVIIAEMRAGPAGGAGAVRGDSG
jgi:hypothetical protein